MKRKRLQEPDSLSQKLSGLAKGVPGAAFLSGSLLVFNAGQLASLTVRPFSERTFRRLNRWGADTWWGWCDTAAKWFHDARILVTGDELPMRENVVCVANHQQMPDITFLMMLARSKDRLGDMKWIVKKPIKYVPGVGWGMSFLDCVFVDRDWTSDERRIRSTFATLREKRVPVWLMVFPEGTRITDHKLEAARRFAAKKELPVPRHVLIPRTKGFGAAVQGLRGHIDAVYDVTIGYKDGTPTLWQYIRGVSDEAHLHVRRYPIEDIPETTEELSSWLLSRFSEKDELLETFYRRGAFPS